MDKIYEQQFKRKPKAIDTKKLFESWKTIKPKQKRCFEVNKAVYHRMYKEFQMETIINSIDKKIWRQLKTKLRKFYASFKDNQEESLSDSLSDSVQMKKYKKDKFSYRLYKDSH